MIQLLLLHFLRGRHVDMSEALQLALHALLDSPQCKPYGRAEALGSQEAFWQVVDCAELQRPDSGELIAILGERDDRREDLSPT